MAGKRRHQGFQTELHEDPQRRSPLFEGLTELRGADVTGKPGDTPDLKGMLLAAYGPGRRTEIDTRSAAKDLGVSQRTVQRWLATEEHQRTARPKAQNLARLATRSRQAATTQAGRRRAMQAVRQSRKGKALRNFGGKIYITGKQGVEGGGGFYIRYRTIGIPPTGDLVPPADIEGLWAAYERGGEKSVSQWLTDYADQHYAGDWTFETIDDIRVELS